MTPRRTGELGKRTLDVVASAVGLVALAPALAATGLAIKIDSPGPVLFGQTRMGREFRPFKLWKFRTMVVDAEAKGPGITATADPRITRVGRLLRDFKLDELPQLWNVLRGDMSLVGPRPELPRYVQQFRKQYAEILRVRPGITDEAAIAFRHEERLLGEADDTEREYVERILPQKIELYLRYVQTASFTGDLIILVKTLLEIAKP